MFSMFKNLVGSKTLSKEDLAPVLEKMKDHLIGELQLWNTDIFLRLSQGQLCGKILKDRLHSCVDIKPKKKKKLSYDWHLLI